jgi:uroporphyrinogen decarboxylase
MNKIERVRAAVAREPVDRVPAGFWLHFPRMAAHGAASVAAHLAYHEATGTDFVKVMNEHPYESGVSVSTPDDWRRMRPAPIESSFFQAQLDEVRGIVAALAGECLTTVTVFGPYASGNHASGGKVTDHLRQDPEAVSQGLAAIADSLAGFAVACLGAGASGIYYSAQGGERDRFTEDEFCGYLRPHDMTVLRAIEGAGELNILHVCGDRVRLDLYADYPSHVVNWAATKDNPSLVDGRDLFDRTILGGLDDRGVIVDGTADEIGSAVRAVIDGFGSKGLILGADCTVPTDIDLGNIRAAVDATGG